MKTVLILQSAYIPWKGYFDLINMVDEFVLYDDVQYRKRDWRSRNKIKTSENSTVWLTVPVRVKGKFNQKIKDCIVANHTWANKHWKTIQRCYAHAEHFETLAPWLRDLYAQCRQLSRLSEINYVFINNILNILGIRTRITWSADYEIIGNRTERLLNICLQTGATDYLSGPAAHRYLDETVFSAHGIEVHWMDYDGYPEYCQLFSPPFIHKVSILDLLLNVGTENAKQYMLSFQ